MVQYFPGRAQDSGVFRANKPYAPPNHRIELGCGTTQSTCGNCDNGVICTQDSDCPGGERCGIGKGHLYGLSFENVCVPDICLTDPVAGGCGTVSSLCGECPCTPQCTDKVCGADPSDGCGDVCRGFCDDREPGCRSDADCAHGSICLVGGGPRLGLAANVNVCLPAGCLDPNPARLPCGTVNSECGLCPQPPADVCEDRVCGVDPTYGVSCGGDCSAGLACVGGKCTRDFTPEARLSQHLKDVRLILESGRKAGAELPLSSLHRVLLESAESAGYGHVVAFDHVLGAKEERFDKLGRRPPYTDQSPFHEIFVLFGYLAACTRRLELVSGIVILPQRQTALVAKQAAAVDVLTGGRLRLGVGIGWNHVEYEALNEDFHTRGRRVSEQIAVMRKLWTEPIVTWEGAYHKLDRAGIK